ncbi:MAG: GtrA family protein [Candidatus Paceibacterota bacterium]|jgi:putative flippase GtrA
MIQRVTRFYTLIDGRYPAQAKILRFLISGGTSTSIDLMLLYVFTDIFGIWYLTSAIVAFIIAFFISFSLQKFWTFRDHSREGMSAQVGLYFVVAGCNLALNTLLVYLFVDYLSFHYLLAQIVASVLIACESFFIYQKFVFRRTLV